MAQTPQPTGPLQKVDSPIALNYDELYDAGYSNYDIAKGIGQEVDKDVDAYLEMGGNVNDFLYVYSNAAEPGSFSAFTDRLMRGLTKSAPIAAGVVGGAKIGARVPVAQPAPTIAGAIIGGLTGAEAGESAVEIGENMGVFETAPPLRQDRFAAVMGDIIGEGLPLVFTAPYMMTGSGSTAGLLMAERLNRISGKKGSIARAPGKAYTAAEDFLRKVGRTARGEEGKTAKRGFYTVEVGATGMSSLGGAIGQESLGGGETGRFGGEIAGGMFEPRLAIMRNLPRFFNSLTGKVGPGARETRIGQKLFETIQKYGEDPNTIIRQLEENPAQMQSFLDDLQVNAELPPLTPAQITGSPVLSLLQNQVAKKGVTSVLDQEALARAEKGYEFIEQLATALIAQGDSESVRFATQLRTDAISDLIEQSLIKANANAVGAANRLGRQDDFDTIGLNLSTQFDQIIKNADEQEGLLWAEVPNDLTVPMDGFFDNVDGISQKFFLDTEDFPPAIAGQINLFRGKLGLTDTPTTTNKAVASAETAINNLPPAAVADYQDVLATIKNPEQNRMFTQNRQVDTVDMDYALTEPVRVIDGIRARRQYFGKSLSAGEKAKLNAAERVANAELKLLKAQRQAGIGPEEAEVGEISVKELTKLRSRVLDEARKAMKDGDRGRAKALGELGNAILTQLDSVAEGGNPAYDLARAFSRGKNDALRRTFLGDIMARDRDGGDVYEPTLLASALFQGGADATAIRFREIQDGASFVQKELDRLNVAEELRVPLNDVDFGPVDQQSLNTAMAQAVQYAAAKVLDPASGRIDARKAASFLEQNKVLLRNFPEVEAMLKDGKQFENMVKLMEKNRGRYDKAVKSNNVLAKILRYESPSVAISEALGSTRPVDSLQSVINTVKKASKNSRFADDLDAEGLSPEDAMDGLKSSLIEWMWTRAGGTGGKFNFAAAQEAMFKPLVKGKTTAATGRTARTTDQAQELGNRARQRVSVADVLEREGVFTKAELDRLEYLMKQGQKIQSAQRAGKLSDEMIDEMGFTADLLMRLAGARFGTGVASATGMKSQGLVEAGAGVRFMKNMMGKVPQGMQLNMLELAVTDPQFMVKLLKKGKTSSEVQNNVRFLNAYLINAGLGLADEDDTSPGPDVEIETPLPQRPPGLGPYKLNAGDRALGPVSMAPQPPRAPTPAPPSAPAPSANVLAQAPSSPATASRMAAAFPGDGIMGLMAARG